VQIKMATKTVPWDSSAALRGNETSAAYIDAVLEDGDPMLLAHALGIVARDKLIQPARARSPEGFGR
jgi:DNA-binding phage protein